MNELKQKTVLAQLVQLQRMDIQGIKAKWLQIFGSTAPAYSRSFLIKRLACRLQELALGAISEQSEARLQLVLKDAGYDPATGAKRKTGRPRGNRSQPPPPGTVLEKHWHGQTFRAVMLARGACELDGTPFNSLSGAAKAICGSTVNGYDFFNLRDKNARRRLVAQEVSHG